ncbi:MAG: hypothetical protein IPM55_00250 [Acidobacteria bacterium]|nr:hypothetical protein [Acidobacteriota bacterium]
MTRFASRSNHRILFMLLVGVAVIGILTPGMMSNDVASAETQKKKKSKKKESPKTRQSDGNAGPSSGAGDSRLSQAEIDQFVDGHNRIRSQAGVPDLKWSDDLARYAQAWADYLGSNGCKLAHRPEDGVWMQKYGENIAAGSPGYASVDQAIKGWESEKSKFRGGVITMENIADIGHYSQIMWKNTTLLGCGKSTSCKTKTIIVCNYDPAGNILGQKPW